MKFALIGSRGYPSTYGGYETFVRVFSPWCVAQGHELTVYCRERPGRRWGWEADGVTCRYTPGLETNTLSTLTFGATSSLDAAARRFDAALVLNIANGFYLPLLKVARTPAALNTDGLEWQRGKWNAAGRAMFRGGARASARWATELVVDSEAIGDIWRDTFDVGSTFIPYGAPIVTDDADDAVRAQGIEPGSYALIVARLIPENHVELTLDAVEHGDGRVPLVVVGSASAASPLEARLEQADREGRLRWLRHVADQRLLTQLWRHAAVYVHGHSVGGTNPALLQALGAGAPTLALDTVFNREVLRDETHLYPNDVAVLAGKLRGLIGSPTDRAAFRERGRQIIDTRYRWDDVCQRYLDVLTRLATSGS